MLLHATRSCTGSTSSTRLYSTNLNQRSLSPVMLRANASSFSPAAAVAAGNPHDNGDQGSSIHSLSHALVKEKSDHHATKLALRSAQSLITSISDENRTLKALKTLLEAIVRNNKTFLRAAEEKRETKSENLVSKADLEHPITKTIIHDFLAQRREGFEKQGLPKLKAGTLRDLLDAAKAREEANARQREAELEAHCNPYYFTHSLMARAESSTKPEEGKVVTNTQDDDKLFDLSQLTSAHLTITPEERNILRHFLDKAASPPRLTTQEKSESEPQTVEMAPAPKIVQNPQPAIVSATAANGADEKAQSVPTPTSTTTLVKNLDKPPTLQIPAQFLAKYRRPKPSAIIDESPIVAAPPVVLKRLIDNPISPIIPEDYHPIKADGNVEDEIETVKRILPGFAPVPSLNLDIKWAMNSLTPAYESQNDIYRAMRAQSVSPMDSDKAMHFWKHPVRFLPNPTEKDLYRTIMIDYIPQDATSKDVLKIVRNGTVESIQLFPPIKPSTTATARVVFTLENPAVLMALQHKKMGDRGQSMQVKGAKVRVWQVTQPTYPPNTQLEADIHEHKYTRFLLIDALQHADAVLPRLKNKLAPELQDGSIVHIGRADDDKRLPLIEFTSIAAAVAAMRRLQEDCEFDGAVFDFDRDYCEDDYDAVL